MSKEINVQEHMKTIISNRVKKIRSEKGLNQQDIYPDDRTYLSLIENINSDKNKDKADKMLPDGVADTISLGLGITKKELCFGNEKETEELVKFIFDEISNVDFWDVYERNKDIKFKEVNRLLLEISWFYSPLSTSVLKVKHGRQFGFSEMKRDKNNVIVEESKLKQMYEEECSTNYKKAIKYIWETEKEDIIISFLEFFGIEESEDNFSFKFTKINKNTQTWIFGTKKTKKIREDLKEKGIDKDFSLIDCLETTISRYKEDPILSIGYRVIDLNKKRKGMLDQEMEGVLPIGETPKYGYFASHGKISREVSKLYSNTVKELTNKQLDFLKRSIN
ncbi:hypothetical protein [uncultured Vagococcus sp.]|uniref:hypothetical protein n=1 Tax=uncultured Vagococcus sp. TaxID=189676 RepID=UPI0025848C30|nr:hypothetical protein [uncultured Vagococcus sp.]